jgi:toxin ParE1/3/4
VRIEWLPEAVRNLETQLAYLGARNPTAAIRLGDAIEASVGHLAEFPESSRTGRVPGTRELVVTGTPFVVVYRVEPEAIVILRILHGAQRWPPR